MLKQVVIVAVFSAMILTAIFFQAGGVNASIPAMPAVVSGDIYLPAMYHTMLASWYGKPFHGRKTANGEVYNMFALSAASLRIPMGKTIEVQNPANGRSVILRINDHGPYLAKRVIRRGRRAHTKYVPHPTRAIDLSYGAGERLGIAEQGVALLNVRVVG